MSLNDPVRVRRSVYRGWTHAGYVTTLRYPGRDLDLFPEGMPWAEVVIADAAEKHVALLQRFKRHWLVQCGRAYGTTLRAGELSEAQALRLARFALAQTDTPADALAERLIEQLDRLLPG